MSRPVVFLFPGQSSRDPEMFERLARVAPEHAARARARVEAATGGTAHGAFETNLEIQVSVFAANLAYLDLVHEAGLRASASAGLSLGEYAHLVHIGAVSPADAMLLVAARGRCYDAGPEGTMAALYPLELMDAEALCQRVCAALQDPEAVAVSNINSPNQIVIAGERAAVEQVLELAAAEHFVNGALIEQRIPMHVARFRPVAAALRRSLEQTPWQPPRAAYWPNVDGVPDDSATAQDIIDRLTRHVYQPVRWRATIDALRARMGNPVFVEVGPLQVLARMLSRRWIAAKDVFALDLLELVNPAAWDRRLDEIHRAAA